MRIYSEAFTSVNNLSLQLAEVNKNQEIILQERTSDLNAKTLELEKSNEIKDKMFSIISHDLRSPIKTLGAFLSIAVSDSGVKPEELQLHLKKIQRDTEVLGHTLENILMWSRSQIKEVITRPVELELKKVVNDTLALYRTMAENKKIKLESTIEDDIKILVDKDHFNLVLRNLVGNALKFTHFEGRVNVTAKTANQLAHICVSDTGTGMTPEQLEMAFMSDIHHTSYGTINEKGTGLGLLLCKEYIEKNNGSIWVESEEGKGTNVYISIPCTNYTDSI